MEWLRRAYELSQSLEMREGYNQPNENLTGGVIISAKHYICMI